ncbi:hypothetical protein D9758_018338 [Tetrapyrgos nigripes]|uniref:Exonuclease domain-containing protein n=1 Tax=Tetrapyrgos nigripes TaxID=182062 RepID=A0A8H5AUQ7_9AGAR|nr:hypothetical protein D9758_018338 [Tetrapyrgos nigripes]
MEKEVKMEFTRPMLLSARVLVPKFYRYNFTQYHPRRGLMSYRTQPMNFHDGPLVWIDCEMTGLNPDKDKILEIAVLITDGDLNIVDDGVEYIIKTDKIYLDGMDAWCTKQHGESGLTEACLKSPHTKDYVSQAVLSYIKKWIPEQRTACLAGNSVHADRSFLVKEMPEVIDWLHYRIVGEIQHFIHVGPIGTARIVNANG